MDQFGVDAPGARLAVRRSDGDGVPLLLLHGGPGVPDYMQSSTAPMLTGFRCISFDQRGVVDSACLLTETWHNYFLDPRSAPDPDPGWLSGSSRIAMIKTDRAISKEGSEALKRASSYEGPVMVLYDAFDIFGAGTDIVRSRFPHAVQVTLENSGHVHWLQNPSGYAKALGEFYERSPGAG